MTYTRANPSPRYRELVGLYRQMHKEGEAFLGIPAKQTFPGMSLLPQATRIKRLVARTGASNILDYGSGKGQQYEYSPVRIEGEGQWDTMMDYWDVDQVHCFDPSYEPFSELPQGRFDGVIATDVLEHCPEEDVPWIIEEMFAYAQKFVFANIACYPAKKRLPTGENAHCTIKPLEWWSAIIEQVAARHPGIEWEVWVQYAEPTPTGPRLVEQRLGS